MEGIIDVNDASSDSFDEYTSLLDRIRGFRRDGIAKNILSPQESTAIDLNCEHDNNVVKTPQAELRETCAAEKSKDNIERKTQPKEGVYDVGQEDSEISSNESVGIKGLEKRPAPFSTTGGHAADGIQNKKAKSSQSEKTTKSGTKEERELKKAQKEEEKRKKQMEREEKQKQKNMEKALKKAESLTRRTEKLDECIKNVVTVLDPKVICEDGSHILQSLEEVGVQYDVKSLPMESSIGWMRSIISYDVNDECEITRKDEYVEENVILLKIKATDFAQMSIKLLMGSDAPCLSLHDFIAKAEDSFPGKSITMLVCGMEAYSKQQKTAENRKFVNRVRNTAPGTSQKGSWISKADLEQVLVSTQLRYGHSVHFCERAEELGKFVAAFTKSVAESPFKRKDANSLSFYGGTSLKSQGGQCGSSVHDIWMKQLQQFNNVSYDIAAAIVSQYPCPKTLFEAYHSCPDETSAKGLLSNIEVRRGHGSLATTRRVGLELSKKLHGLFTSMNPNEMLAK